MARVRLNPLSGELELVDINSSGNGEAVKIVENVTVEAGSSVGDIVHPSLITPELHEVSVDNTSVSPSVGIIMSKSSSTSAKILYQGLIDGFSGLTPGKKVFLSLTGTLTSTPPTTDYMQCMGYALSSTEVYLKPEYQRVKRI